MIARNVGPDSSGRREAPTETRVLNAPAPCPAALSGLDAAHDARMHERREATA